MTQDEKLAMSARARVRAKDIFGMEAMAKRLEVVLEGAVAMGPVPTPFWMTVLAILGLLLAFWVGLSL